MANVAVNPRRKENNGVQLRSRSKLGEELKTFIQNNPIPLSVLAPKNARTTAKKNGPVKASPPSPAPTPLQRPMSSMGSPVVVRKRLQDVRDSQALKPTFLCAMNLISRSTADKIRNRKKIISKSLHQKLSLRKTQAASYFRNNPVPLSSALGKKVVIQAGFGKCSRPEDESARYDKYCAGGRRSAQNLKQETWPVVNARKFKKASPFSHTYSFNKTEKIERLNEIVLGLNKKSSDLYNKCNDFEIRVHRMTDEEIATAMAGVPVPFKQSAVKGKGERSHHTSSEPIAGPSTAIESLAAPAVTVFDIAFDPSMKPYFDKAGVMLPSFR